MDIFTDHTKSWETVLLSLVALCSFILAVHRAYCCLLPKPLPGIPYNVEATKSILGDIPSLVAEVSRTKDLMTWLLRQSQCHNVPLTQVFIHPFGKPYLLLSDMRESQDILLHRIKEFDRSSDMFDIFSGPFPKFHLHMRTGPEWKSHRKILQDLMTPSFLENVAAPAIYDSMLEATKLWTEKARLAPEKAFSAGADIHIAALDAVLAFSFGSQFEHKATCLQVEMLAGMTELASNGDQVVFPEVPLPSSIQSMIDITESITEIKSSVLPRLRWWVISKLPHLARAIRRKNAVIRQELVKAAKALEQDIAGQNDSRIRSAVDHIIDRERKHAQKEGRSADYVSPTLQDEVFGFVVAGHDTTSTTLSWGVKFLADNPETQARLRAALRSSLPDAVREKLLPKGQEIMRATIPYLDATIEEILRCGGTVPAVDRQAIQDTVLLGHHVPKGTSLLMLANGPSMFSPGFPIDETLRSQSSQASEKGHMRFREWNKDDMALFKPERWLSPGTTDIKDGPVGDGDLKFQNASFDAQAGPSMPFGGGIRGCFGRRLAYIEMRTFLITILWTFEFLKCPDEVSGYEAYDGVVHKPVNCFVRLRTAPLS